MEKSTGKMTRFPHKTITGSGRVRKKEKGDSKDFRITMYIPYLDSD